MSDDHSTNQSAFSHGKGKRRPPGVSIEDWFWSYVRKTEDCWIWVGNIKQKQGENRCPVGLFLLNGQRLQAHRAAWILTHGDPGDEQVMHRCETPLCVRPDHLWVSDLASRFWTYVRKAGPDECWEWLGCRTAGKGTDSYGRIQTGEGLDGAHRVSWRLHYGDIPEGRWVLHKCDQRFCVNPSHLFLGDCQANVDDMVSKGRNSHGEMHWARKSPERMPRGEKVSTARLTEQQVRDIRRRFAAGEANKLQLAREYGVAPYTIHCILARITWRHVE